MGDLRVTTITGADTVLKDAAVQAFKASLRGELLSPDDHGYDRARRIWNGMVDRHPAMIVQCAGVGDVISAVNLARSSSLLVAVRGGGHNVAGNAVCDGGIMIDLSRMKSVRVDELQRSGAIGIRKRHVHPHCGSGVPSGAGGCQLSHGLLTYALVEEGLKTAAAAKPAGLRAASRRLLVPFQLNAPSRCIDPSAKLLGSVAPENSSK